MSELDTEVHRVCSWCSLQFANEIWSLARYDEITTWGICPDCLERLHAACRKRRSRIRAAAFPRRKLPKPTSAR